MEFKCSPVVEKDANKKEEKDFWLCCGGDNFSPPFQKEKKKRKRKRKRKEK